MTPQEEKIIKIVNLVPACSTHFIQKYFLPEEEKELTEVLNSLVKGKFLKDIAQRRGTKDNRFWIAEDKNVDEEKDET